MTQDPCLAPVARAMCDLVDRREFAGIATVAYRDDHLIHRAACGVQDLSGDRPMASDTIVRAFSMTKPVTAVAMMILHDCGLWRPEDPITKHIPEFKGLRVFQGLDDAGGPILALPKAPPTLAQLMTHTAGFSYGSEPGHVDDLYRAADIWTATGADDFVARIGRLPLLYEPGAEWRYSISMDLQGVIIERLSGLNLPDFMRRYIFAPLNMADTDFHSPAEQRARLAALYRWKDGALHAVRTVPLVGEGLEPPGFASGGGGLFSTADDYIRFARMLLGEGQLDGARIISAAAARQMMTRKLSPEIIARRFGVGLQQLRPGYEYGYNGVVVTDPLAAGVALGRGTYLWDGLASTWFWVDPENRIAFVGMVQRAGDPEMPQVQPISQHAVFEALGLS